MNNISFVADKLIHNQLKYYLLLYKFAKITKPITFQLSSTLTKYGNVQKW